ncbi:coenzyme PQQ synthesis protein D [Allostella vacuolata]|nr:coenzyme PQQ synthesis protein D [Stella vacuolata]
MLTAEARPRLAPGVRIQRDEARDAWLVQAPERLVYPDEVAMSVLALCNGERTVHAVIEDAAREYGETPDTVGDDVRALLSELEQYGVLVDAGR